MNAALYVSVALGYIAGLAASFVVARRILATTLRGRSFDSRQRRTVVRLAAAGGVVSLVPALALGTVIGATLGAAAGDAIFVAIGLGRTGAAAGVLLGVFVMAAFILIASIAIGAWLGRYIVRSRMD
jgi:hypothetical protein